MEGITMIIKLNEGLRASLFEFLKKEAEINLFIIGDVELFGFDKNFQEVWAQLDRDMSYRAVLLRYKTHFVFYAPSIEYNATGFLDIITSYDDRFDLSGKREILTPLLEKLECKKIREQYFSKLSSKEELLKLDSHCRVEDPSVEDAEEIYSLREQIAEFKDFETTIENTRESLKGEMGRYLVTRLEGKIVSCASTTAENSMSAMVVSVMTHPEYRKRGLAGACVQKLCEELLEEGKGLCLFYDNPKAGSVYRKLGFKEIGQWSSVFF
jgi:predicted GNAT family acetyltransferase